MNVLYDGERTDAGREVRSIYRENAVWQGRMFPYAGVLWFESGGRNYRLTRDLHREDSVQRASL